MALWLNGPLLDIAALSSAMDELYVRHEILRSTIRIVDDQPQQYIEPLTGSALTVRDLRDKGLDAADVIQMAEHLAQQPFDLSRGPVARMLLLRTNRDRCLFLIAMHHVAGDQWSLGLLGREVAYLYNSHRQGLRPQLQPLPITYRDYAIWQRSAPVEMELERQLDFWREQLADPAPLELPTDHPRPQMRSLRGSFCTAPLPVPLIESLEALCHRVGATLFMSMLGAFAVLLHRITGQADIPIGVPVANRTESATEGLIGTFVNTLVLRADLAGNPQFVELLRRMRMTCCSTRSPTPGRFLRQTGQGARSTPRQQPCTAGSGDVQPGECSVARHRVRRDRVGAGTDRSRRRSVRDQYVRRDPDHPHHQHRVQYRSVR